ncbi:MAG: hypothetical protein K1X57_22860 [Gemmataceae bacterium]|nr:hypothetical protein [Gemmataceae bacterium]
MSVLAEPMNGRPQRKQLSDQLDRLDGIIDCLADGLNQAVADAVRDGTQAALQQLVLETLRNPDTLELLRRALATHPVPAAEPAAPSRTAAFLARCKAGLAAIGARAKRILAAGGAIVRSTVVRTGTKAKGVLAMCRLAWHLKRAALVGVAVGGTVAAAALVSHPVATVLSGVCAAATAFTVQVALHCRKALRPWMA